MFENSVIKNLELIKNLKIKIENFRPYSMDVVSCFL